MYHQFSHLDPEIIHLNAGTISPTPDRVLKNMFGHMICFESNPAKKYIEVIGQLWQVQKKIANFFHGNAQDFFLRPNITEVINCFLLGAPLQEDEVIAVSDLEYGAVVNSCRYRAEMTGQKIVKFVVPESVDAHEIFQAITKAANGNKVGWVVISHIMTANGQVIPLAELATLTRAAGMRIIVDGAHAPGSITLDFDQLKKSGVDYYGGNFHKWMMGPKGTAFGWVHPDCQQELKTTTPGWTTYEIQRPYDLFGDGHHFTQRFLMVGSRDKAPFLALTEMLDLWNDWGFEKIQQYRMELRQELDKSMANHLNWKRLTPDGLHGPLLAYEIPTSTFKSEGINAMLEIYQNAKLQVSIPKMRDRYILRMSPGLHNQTGQMENAVARLSAYIKK